MLSFLKLKNSDDETTGSLDWAQLGLKTLWLTILLFTILTLALKFFIPLYAINNALYSVAFSAALVIISILLIYLSEGTQQAASLIHAADKDSLERIFPERATSGQANYKQLSAQRKLDFLKRLKDNYYYFLDGRQFFTLIFALLLKTALDQIPKVQPEIDKGTARPSFQNIQPEIRDFLIFSADSTLVTFLITVTITVWFAQLLPKRFAQERPVSFLSFFPTCVANFCVRLGRLGIGLPTTWAQNAVQSLFPALREQQGFPTSAQKSFRENVEIFGPYVRRRKVQIYISDAGSSVREFVEYAFERKYFQWRENVTRLRHIHKCVGPVTCNDHKFQSAADLKPAASSFYQLEQKTEILREEGRPEFQSYENVFHFEQPFGRELPVRNIDIVQLNFELDTQEVIAEGPGEKTRFDIYLEQPIETLEVEIVTSKGLVALKPKALIYFDYAGDYKPFGVLSTAGFKELDSNERHDGGWTAKVHYPIIGTKISLEFEISMAVPESQ